MLEEADRLGLWLVCPPPRAVTPIAEIGPAFDRVLGLGLGRRSDRRRARSHAALGRPGAGGGSPREPAADLPPADRSARLQPAGRPVADRPPAAGHEPGDEPTMPRGSAGSRCWPGRARRFGPPCRRSPTRRCGSSLWPWSPVCRRRCACRPSKSACWPTRPWRRAAAGCCSSPIRPWTAPDPETQQRAMTLELLNLELELMEPWAAAGSFVRHRPSPSTPRGGRRPCCAPSTPGCCCRSGRRRWRSACRRNRRRNALALVVPGVPEASNAYELTPGGVQPLRHKRVAGGMQSHLDEFGLTTQVLWPTTRRSSARFAAGRRRSGVARPRLQRELAVHEAQHGAGGGRPACRRARPLPRRPDGSMRRERDLQTCDRQLAAGDAPDATRKTPSGPRVRCGWWNAPTGTPPSRGWLRR